MVDVIDIPPSEIRSQGLTIDTVRIQAIHRVAHEAIDAVKEKGGIDSLEMAVRFLHQSFRMHHSPVYLEEVDNITSVLKGKADIPKEYLVEGMLLGTRLKASESREGRKIQANLLLDWYGLITKFLFPHEGLGDVKEGIMRRGFYEDKLLVEFEKKQYERLEKAKKQYAEQIKEGKTPDQVRFDV